MAHHPDTASMSMPYEQSARFGIVAIYRYGISDEPKGMQHILSNNTRKEIQLMFLFTMTMTHSSASDCLQCHDCLATLLVLVRAAFLVVELLGMAERVSKSDLMHTRDCVHWRLAQWWEG